MKFYVLLVCFGICYRVGYSQTILGFGISEYEQQEILDLHNNFRRTVANGTIQPRGSNLLEMKYDSALAEQAQIIANTTIFAHVEVTDDRWVVGQNLYMSLSTGAGGTASWNAAVTAWYNEYTLYTYGLCCTSGTGHYTQMVWSDTEYVGCGYTYFFSTNAFPYGKLYVCNYGPAGNWVGEYPYETEETGCENLC